MRRNLSRWLDRLEGEIYAPLRAGGAVLVLPLELAFKEEEAEAWLAANHPRDGRPVTVFPELAPSPEEWEALALAELSR